MGQHKALWLAVALILALTAACSKSPAPGPTRSPNAVATDLSSGCDLSTSGLPAWLPKHLPLPNGTFLADELSAPPGQHRAIFVVPLPIQALAAFVHKRWPSAGYTLGRTQISGGQATGSFLKPPARGTFLAQSRCGKGRTIVLLGYEATSPSPSSS